MSSDCTTACVLPAHIVKGRRHYLSVFNTFGIVEPTHSNLGHHSSPAGQKSAYFVRQRLDLEKTFMPCGPTMAHIGKKGKLF